MKTWAAWWLVWCVGASAVAAAASPRALELQHTAVELRFDWAARQAVGRAVLTLMPRRPVNVVTLDANALHVERVALADGRALRFDQRGGLRVHLPQRVPAAAALTLAIDYRTGHVNDSDPAAIWGSTGKGLRFLAPSPTDPRRRRQVWVGSDPGSSSAWMPGLDAPDALRTTELTLTVPAPLMAVASGEPHGVVANADGTRSWRFVTRQPAPPQRSVFVIGEYADVPQQAGGTDLHNLSNVDETSATAASVAALPEMLHFMQTQLARPYPQPSYRQVFVQELPWGTAGTGLAVQTENMVDDQGTHNDFKYLWHSLQAETLAQQWFGGEVPICDWGHVWLERALARHLSQRWAEQLHGASELQLWHLQFDQAAALADDADPSARSAVVVPQPRDTVAFVTGNAPYLRGAVVLQMLRRELGEAAWSAVLQRYLSERAGKPSCTADFQRVAEAASGRPLGWFFAQWLYRAGHPVFKVHQRHDAARGELMLSVTQTQSGPPYAGAIDVAVDGAVHTLRLAARRSNVLRLPAAVAPRLVTLDPDGIWLKEVQHAKSDTQWLYQLRHADQAASRQQAMTELARRHALAGASAAFKAEVVDALLALATQRDLYWRLRFNALTQLAALLPAGKPLAPPVEQAMLNVIEREAPWLRTAALRVLGASGDARHAPLYIRQFAYPQQPSDRVVNAAAIALGKSGSPLALPALIALDRRPSWKNQSRISALAGLKELRDARSVPWVQAQFDDLNAARWTLATPVWDYRLAAAQALAALGATTAAHDAVQARFERALADGQLNDSFANLQLAMTLGDARTAALFAPLRARYAANPRAQRAVADAQQQWVVRPR